MTNFEKSSFGLLYLNYSTCSTIFRKDQFQGDLASSKAKFRISTYTLKKKTPDQLTVSRLQYYSINLELNILI
ncbi:unnamed protein product [Caenorhabditis angaria]|uniref:Uncharacterized protein n=1 Tax=Caenorhabditis angaria TaxID=860376 RepID=A0A9P1N4F0_9PELO|nr:unnamed protein product [Caenorhabditis angaria]